MNSIDNATTVAIRFATIAVAGNNNNNNLRKEAKVKMQSEFCSIEKMLKYFRAEYTKVKSPCRAYMVKLGLTAKDVTNTTIIDNNPHAFRADSEDTTLYHLMKWVRCTPEEYEGTTPADRQIKTVKRIDSITKLESEETIYQRLIQSDVCTVDRVLTLIANIAKNK